MLVDRAREVIRRCHSLAAYSEEPGVITRTFLSEPMRAVHADVSGWMKAAGMSVDVDAAGNIRGTYPASAPAAKRLFIGSHLDTVPRGGAFDGILGVVLGIDLVAQLDGGRLPYSIEVVGFSEEEGVRFGVPFIGSRALAGTLDDDLLERHDAKGRRLRDAIRDFGLDPSAISDARVADGALGYLEIHIEQGPVLDGLGVPLGIVDAIAGQSRADAVFIGAAGHAGTTPMSARRDAVACAAEWIASVEREGQATPGLVATVGHVDAIPGADNVIAGACRASLDVRHVDNAARSAAVGRLRQAACDIAARRGLTVDWQSRLDANAVRMSPPLVDALTRAVERSDARAHVMPSGAGHDAMILAGRMPVAMLFVRSPGGISHHPDERVSEGDVAAALAVGSVFLDELTGGARA